MTRIALVDVDDLLLLSAVDIDLGGEDSIQINEAVLNKFQKLAVQELYLFTDMTFTPGAIRERQLLVAGLRMSGFKVLGIITPADCGWNLKTAHLEGLSALLNQEENRPRTEKDFRKGESKEQSVTESKEQAQKEQLPLCVRIQNNEFYRSLNFSNPRCLGRAFHEASVAIENPAIFQKAQLAKNFANTQGLVSGYEHPTKGMMYNLFLRNHQSAINECYVFDATFKALDTIDSINRSAQNGLLLRLFHMQRKKMFVEKIKVRQGKLVPRIVAEVNQVLLKEVQSRVAYLPTQVTPIPSKRNYSVRFVGEIKLESIQQKVEEFSKKIRSVSLDQNIKTMATQIVTIGKVIDSCHDLQVLVLSLIKGLMDHPYLLVDPTQADLDPSEIEEKIADIIYALRRVAMTGKISDEDRSIISGIKVQASSATVGEFKSQSELAEESITHSVSILVEKSITHFMVDRVIQLAIRPFAKPEEPHEPEDVPSFKLYCSVM